MHAYVDNRRPADLGFAGTMSRKDQTGEDNSHSHVTIYNESQLDEGEHVFAVDRKQKKNDNATVGEYDDEDEEEEEDEDGTHFKGGRLNFSNLNESVL